MISNLAKIFCTGLFVLSTSLLTGQIDVLETKKFHNTGLVYLQNEVTIDFVFNESKGNYEAKLTYTFEKMVLDNEQKSFLVQIPFSSFESVDVKKGKIFRIDSTGYKVLMQNVKVKYLDVKDYFIDNIFYHDLKIKQFKAQIELPREYIVQYEYERTISDLKFLNSFYLQYNEAGTENSKITIHKHPDIDFSVYEFNLDDGVEKEETEKFISYHLGRRKKITTNDFTPGGSYFLPHIIISVNTVKILGSTQKVLGSTDDLYSWYNSLIKELEPSSAFISQLSNKIISQSNSQEEKIESIFKWVQQNIQYVAFEDGIAGFKPAEAEEVAKNRFGDCKGMANLLVQLLKVQGIDSRHVWLGTRSKNYKYSVPSLIVDNHMICGVKFNGEMYYLDGTSKTATWKNPPSSIEGQEVLVANSDRYFIDTIQISESENNQLEFNSVIDISKKIPRIQIKVKLNGHFYENYESYLQYSPKKEASLIPYFISQEYLKGMIVKEVKNIQTENGVLTFEIEGNFLNYAKNQARTFIFPFLDVIVFPLIPENGTPISIPFEHQITCTTKIIGGQFKSQIEEFPPLFMTDLFSAKTEIRKEGADYLFHQEFIFKSLNIPGNQAEDWNSYRSKIAAYQNTPFLYE